MPEATNQNTGTQTIAPAASRIASLDAIRGVAVHIFVINLMGFGLG